MDLIEVIFKRENLDKGGASFCCLHFDCHVVTGDAAGQIHCQAEDLQDLFCKLFSGLKHRFN